MGRTSGRPTASSIIGTIAWLSGRAIAVALPVPFQEDGKYSLINTVPIILTFVEYHFGITGICELFDFPAKG
jgi:hypothetical protein